MTPLATYLAKQLILPPKKRHRFWAKHTDLLREKLADIHCFEVTEILDLAQELSATGKGHMEGLLSVYGFLPAPKTWIEWQPPSPPRHALLLEQVEPDPTLPHPIYIGITAFFHETVWPVGGLASDGHVAVNPGTVPMLSDTVLITQRNTEETAQGLVVSAALYLILINTPRIIGRRQHMPRKTLERKLVKGLRGGKFPLHAWTEIKLQVAKPIEIDDGEPHEAHLTGRRALHFVRKHLRIRLGQLEYVSAHWRGDPSIGLKRSRYTVTP